MPSICIILLEKIERLKSILKLKYRFELFYTVNQQSMKRVIRNTN